MHKTNLKFLSRYKNLLKRNDNTTPEEIQNSLNIYTKYPKRYKLTQEERRRWTTTGIKKERDSGHLHLYSCRIKETQGRRSVEDREQERRGFRPSSPLQLQIKGNSRYARADGLVFSTPVKRFDTEAEETSNKS